MWDAIKKLLVQFIMKYVVTALIPMLANPLLGGIAAFILRKLVDFVGEELALMLALKKIDITVKNQDAQYTEAKNKLHEEISKPVEEQDKDKINAATEEFKKNFQRLVDMRKLK